MTFVAILFFTEELTINISHFMFISIAVNFVNCKCQEIHPIQLIEIDLLSCYCIVYINIYKDCDLNNAIYKTSNKESLVYSNEQ